MKKKRRWSVKAKTCTRFDWTEVLGSVAMISQPNVENFYLNWFDVLQASATGKTCNKLHQNHYRKLVMVCSRVNLCNNWCIFRLSESTKTLLGFSLYTQENSFLFIDGCFLESYVFDKTHLRPLQYLTKLCFPIFADNLSRFVTYKNKVLTIKWPSLRRTNRKKIFVSQRKMICRIDS